MADEAVCAFLSGRGSCTCWPADLSRPCACRTHPGEPTCASCKCGDLYPFPSGQLRLDEAVPAHKERDQSVA